MSEPTRDDGKRARSNVGNFFIVDRRTWKDLCDLDDINAAAAWLLMAQGTGRNNRTTPWSVDSIIRYLGIGHPRAKAAIDRLLTLKFIRHGEKHTPRKPRYDLLDFEERKTAKQKPPKNHLVAVDDDPGSNLIWLPNTLVKGTSQGENSPVRKLRAAGDPWALRLLIDLYHEHNLRDDGGVSRKSLWDEYEAVQIGEQGPYRIMGFKHAGLKVAFAGPFQIHRSRPMPTLNSQPAFDSVYALEDIGVLTFVPHLLENETENAEVIHPFGIGGHSEHPIETEIGENDPRLDPPSS